ncbi:MAG: SDR family NAD(P)-dependent oxidoreductase, partial [Chloroflexi bacterium]
MLGVDRATDKPILLGSVKTNIGHLEAAAGIAGLIKVVLSLQNREIPPHLHFSEPNPYILWDQLPVEVAAKRMSWAASDTGRLAGLSSFGFSGVNAHVVLGEAPEVVVEPLDVKRPLHTLTLSAKTESALIAQAKQFEIFLRDNQNVSFPDVCFTMNNGRSHFQHRLAVAAESAVDAQEKLAAFAAGQSATGIVAGTVKGTEQPEIAFLFTGQGSQYVGMGRQLYATQPAFRAALDECDALLRPYLDRPLLSVLYPENHESPINDTAYTQPALFAIEYALAQLWQSWGIKPAAVMGHSVGEYVAACVAGVFSLKDGLKLIAERGRLMQDLPQNGAMAAIFATEAEVRAAMSPFADTVSIAAVNGPENVVISGLETAVSSILDTLHEKGVKTRTLTVSHAFHSHLMEPMLDEFEKVAASVSYSAPTIDLVSNVTGKMATAAEVTNPAYWRNHVRAGVRFAAAIQTLHDSGYELFFEVGPNPTLTGMGQRCLPKGVGNWLYSLRNGRNDWQMMLNSLSEFYAMGVNINWAAYDQVYARQRVWLPTYPFQRKRYWIADGLYTKRSSTPLKQLAAQSDASEMNDWLYEIDWQAQPRNADILTPAQPGHWLILADEGGVGAELANQLQAKGESCQVVQADAVDLTNKADFEVLFKEMMVGGKRPLRGIVHLWSLNAQTATTAGELKNAQLLGSGSALHILQALIAAEANFSDSQKNELPQLWLTTRAAQPVGNASVSFAQSPLWGLGKTIAIEHPKLWGGLIDLDTTVQAASDAERLCAEILQPDGEQQIAFRDDARFGARLVQSQNSLTDTELVQFNSEGAYLVTGAFGGLGLQLAQWLAEQGAKSLVLLGRTPLPSREAWGDENGRFTNAIQLIQKLESQNIQVHTAAVDVTDEVQLSEFMSNYEAQGLPAICGVVHAAGVLQDKSLQKMSLSELSTVMAPKVTGSWLLHQYFESKPLDFFVLFSSAASLGGSAGQGNYAAANGFMDALAHHRHQQGLPAISINWGPWDEVGMAAETDLAKQPARRSMVSIAPTQGLDLLGHLINQEMPQLGVMPATLAQLRQLLPADSTFIAAADVDLPLTVISPVAETNILDSLRTANAAERVERMLVYLRVKVANAMMMAPEEISPDLNVMELGLDSIMVMELVTKLDKDLQINLFPREIFERPSIIALSEYLIAQVVEAGGLESTTPATTGAAIAPTAGVNGLGTRPTPLPEIPTQRNPSMVFLLSGPRSGSTLLRVMLAGHPELFSPPELHLLAYNDLAERNPNLDRSYLAEGLQRAVMELTGLDAEGSAAMMDEWEAENLSIQDVYRRLQEMAGPRVLVDKSPSYTTH